MNIKAISKEKAGRFFIDSNQVIVYKLRDYFKEETPCLNEKFIYYPRAR